MKTIAIIQARMGSTRLPGKSLLPIGGKPLIWHVAKRTAMGKAVDSVILATTTDKSDDGIADFARKEGIESFRGNTEDVLDRFYNAAKKAGAGKADVVVRITGDSPLVDPALIDKAVGMLVKGKLDYVSNSRQPWMDGFDVEAFTFAALERAWIEAKMASEREHVTPYIRESGKFKVEFMENDPALDGVQCSVDRQEDLEFVREIIRRMAADGKGEEFSYMDVIALLKREPRLRDINRQSVVNEGYFKSLKEDRRIK
ncbi:MAG: glycosyltransferase family protein [Candidatus Micrarchaeota archaeon]|nr:glycosyltransferase family protein [Candidatus Micrarchaeota archaeon]